MQKMPHNHNKVEAGMSFDPHGYDAHSHETFATQLLHRSSRKRQQARKACIHCKRLHARCSDERPCKRCEHNGLASSCVDSPRKQRVSRSTSRGNGP